MIFRFQRKIIKILQNDGLVVYHLAENALAGPTAIREDGVTYIVRVESVLTQLVVRRVNAKKIQNCGQHIRRGDRFFHIHIRAVSAPDKEGDLFEK